MTKAWRAERKRDHYYRSAKARGYRSRAAFKLLQIHKKFDLIQEGDTVVDLGAAPGGWTQVAAELVGEKGRVLALDVKRMRAIEGVEFVHGDITSEEVMRVALATLGGKADVVLSDMAPDMSGTYSMDHARSIHLCAQALTFAADALRPGGSLLLKVFQGDMQDDLMTELERRFRSVRVHRPKASRKQSSEAFVLCRGFRG